MALLLEDDTGARQDAFAHDAGGGVLTLLLDHPALGALETAYRLDLTAYRRSDAWQPLALLHDTTHALATAVGAGVRAGALERCRVTTEAAGMHFHESYYAEDLPDDLRSILAMLRLAELRGAARVRWLVA